MTPRHLLRNILTYPLSLNLTDTLVSISKNMTHFGSDWSDGFLGCFHTWFDCLVRTRVRLLPPAPAGLCSYYFIWVRTAVRLRHQASSCLPRCLVTTAREEAAKCIRLLSALLYIYVFEPLVLFTKLRYITALTSAIGMYCKCSKER